MTLKQALQNDTSVSIAGQYQTMKEVKRKDSWKKLFVKLENGMLTVHKNAKVSFLLVWNTFFSKSIPICKIKSSGAHGNLYITHNTDHSICTHLKLLILS